MRIFLIALLLWPGTMLAQSCGKEEKVMQNAANKLAQCRNKPKKPKAKTPKQLYTELWTAATKRHKKETAALQRKHFQEHQAIVKKTGFDPQKEKAPKKKKR